MRSDPITNRPEGIGAAYLVVTLGYWAFMLTDGALRMLVLLHFHELGFHPIQLAYLFLGYELMGVLTNLGAGWLAARFGLTRTLYAGLALQIGALLALSMLDETWSVAASVAFVMVVQGLSGIAKDLTKMSAKSSVKLLVPKDQSGALFRWVAVLTGSKNAVKGLGFLLGAGLLAWFGFEVSVLAMAAVLSAVLLLSAASMPQGLPGGRAGVPFRDVFSKDPAINWLSAARVFLFGARDVWFVVGIPIYFHSVFSDGSPEQSRIAFFLVGGFMALWIIGYGAVQALAPQVLKAKGKPVAEIVRLAVLWVALLASIPAVLAIAAALSDGPSDTLTAILIAGLLLFGVVFAVNSSAHSYLILAFAKGERVSMDVGFYYMSNAVGRLLGTLLSGVSYQIGGLPLCLGTAAAMAGLSWIMARRLTALEHPEG
ncbi:MAG: organoarsenical effux MFS transporter ArsJ [Neomegalonema sp.]|nr:organoarsenical effux MFS transporter ArsJ [Neomegalonema sp.]